MTSGRPVVFLDRDGVLLRSYQAGGRTKPAAGMEEYEVAPGVRGAVAALKSGGFALVVVTNQPNVARGTLRREVVEGINRRLQDELRLDAVYTCFHDDADACDCRKPLPGLLTRAARDLGLDISASAMVGDRWSDVLAGQAAGCRLNILLDYPYSQAEKCEPDVKAPDLAAAAVAILSQLVIR
jgi:D-glycero-D-manno-heptose 1,7-bisphosphate phosphatase